MLTMQEHNKVKTYTYPHSNDWATRFFILMMKIVGAKGIINKSIQQKTVNHRKAAMPKTFYKNYHVQTHDIQQHKIWTIAPKEKAHDKTIFFLHGGAYIFGVQFVYWGFIAALIKETKAKIIVLDYPLTPEYTAAEVYPFVEASYDWALANHSNPSDLILLGDSAGGGLGLGFTQYLRTTNKPQPAQLILLSPWLDLALTNTGILPIEDNDPILSVDGLRQSGTAYAGSWKKTDYRISPIHGTFQDLPPISLFISQRDILYPDCEQLKTLLSAEGIELNYFLYPHLFHDWVVIGTSLNASKMVLQQIKLLIT